MGKKLWELEYKPKVSSLSEPSLICPQNPTNSSGKSGIGTGEELKIHAPVDKYDQFMNHN
jgi:hypothetical protein